jgi:RNA polymerase sigma-70 factor (ECF subfamily)
VIGFAPLRECCGPHADGELRSTPSAEQTAVGTAFRLYGRYVAATAYRVLRQKDDVDDVVQEVFLDAIRGLDRIRDQESTRAWLTVVTLRLARKKLRSRGVFALESEEYEQVPANGLDPEQYLRLTWVAGILESLPSNVRSAWILHCMEGLGLPEVARACACSVTTVKRRIAFVRARIARA